MKSERKEAADIVRRLDDAATRAKRGRGLDALKDWDTAEFDGFSTRSSSGLEQLRHWDDAPTSQVIPLTPLPLKDVPAIGPAPSLTATKLASSETETEAKRDLYQAEMPTTAPFIQPAISPVSPPTIISHPTVTSQTTPTSQKQQAALSGPAVAASFSDRGMVSPLKAERLQTRQEPSSGPAATSSLKKHAVGMLQNQAAAPGISSTVKPTAEGAAAPAVRLTGAMGAALVRHAAITQPRLNTLASSSADGRSKNRPVSGPRSYEGSREPKLVTKPQPDRPVLQVKADEAADFTPAQRAGINAGITIGTGLALAAVTVWLLVWFVSQSMSMVMDSLRAFVQ